jgi:hypothetical protein
MDIESVRKAQNHPISEIGRYLFRIDIRHLFIVDEQHDNVRFFYRILSVADLKAGLLCTRRAA